MIPARVRQAMKSTISPLILILLLWSAAPAQTAKRRGTARKPTVDTTQPQLATRRSTNASKSTCTATRRSRISGRCQWSDGYDCRT